MATEACKKGHIRINGEVAKASKEVFPQDKIQNYEIMVNDLPESRVGAKLVALYCTDNTPEEAFEIAKMQQQAQEYYRQKGEGRPTKKDRRELEEFLNTDN